MRNIPFAFLNEETINQINRSERERVDAFVKLADTQNSMRGLLTWPDAPAMGFSAAVKKAAQRFLALLESIMEMNGPNSIQIWSAPCGHKTRGGVASNSACQER